MEAVLAEVVLEVVVAEALEFANQVQAVMAVMELAEGVAAATPVAQHFSP